MKRRNIWAVSTILILSVSGFFIWKNFKSKSNTERFKTVTVERGSIRVMVQATGTTMPQNRLELKPPIAGRLETILVREGDAVEQGEILAWLSSTERAALLDAARAQGEKELAYWEGVYKPTPLVAPMSGVIIVRSMEPGQTVTAQDAPLVMSNRLIVKAQVDETDIGQLRSGLKVETTLDAYPNLKIPGKIGHIAYESKTVNNVTMYEVDVLPERIPPFMRAGMTANLTFIVREKEHALLLPQEAVRNVDDETRVLVPSAAESKGGKKSSVAIETGLSDGKKVEVVAGLAEGDRVLVVEMGAEKQSERRGGSNPLNPFGGVRRGGRSGGGR